MGPMVLCLLIITSNEEPRFRHQEPVSSITVISDVIPSRNGNHQ
jgi:hypothetical protein